MTLTAQSILAGRAAGPILATREPLSFWGGIDPATGQVIDTHHPLHGRRIAGTILMMPSTRGSCTGSGVLLDLALSGRGPAALIFREPEDVATLGALIAAEMFGRTLPVVRLSQDAFAALSGEARAEITASRIDAGALSIPLTPAAASGLELAPQDRAMLEGAEG